AWARRVLPSRPGGPQRASAVGYDSPRGAALSPAEKPRDQAWGRLREPVLERCRKTSSKALARTLRLGSRAPMTRMRSPGLASPAKAWTRASRLAANDAVRPRAATSATRSAAEKSRLALPPA